MHDAAASSEADTEAYLRLLGQHERWLASYVYTLVPLAADADDILQDIKVTMWRQFAKFETGTNFRAWARQIAVHQILNYRRSAARRLSPGLEESFIQAVAEETDRRGEELERRGDALKSCLEKLSDAHRKIIVWRYYENCTIEEIAARSQRSADAVYQILSRVRTLLNDCVTRRLAAQS